jgi:hypothetical protein
MFNRKKKIKLSYDIEGNNFIVSDYVINKKNNTKPSDSLQPIQPTQPTDQPIQPPSQSKPIRPGDIDPYYRYIEPTINVKKNKVEPNTSNEFEKPGGIDPFYNHIQKYNKSKTFNEKSDLDKKPGTDIYYSGGSQQITTDPFKLALMGPNINDAEGLKRAYESDTNTYMYKGVLYVAGTKGGIFGSDMRENFQYIGIPNLKSAITYNMAQIGATGAAILPEVAVPALVGVEVASMFGRPLMSDNVKKEMDVNSQVEKLTRFKDAEKAYLANKGYIQRVVGDSSGAAVIQQLKNKYPEIEGGRGYGAPIVDLFARSKIKGIFQDEKDTRDALYKDDIKNIPEKIVNDTFQKIAEKALGLENFKSTKESGIEQIRTFGDPIAGLNNSATTIIAPVADIMSNNTLTHSYQLTASNYSTSKDTTGAANGWVNDDKTISLFQ